jgi:predicted outer membrane protein
MWRPLAWLLVLLLSFMPAAQAADPRVAATEAFLPQAVAVLKFGSASSQLALRKTKSDAVQGVAHQMSLDYSAAGMKFRQAVADTKLPPPRDVLDERHKALFDELSRTAPGKAFAKAWPEAQAAALREDVELFQAYGERGDNERLKYFAREMVPLLRGQLEQVEKLRR